MERPRLDLAPTDGNKFHDNEVDYIECLPVQQGFQPILRPVAKSFDWGAMGLLQRLLSDRIAHVWSAEQDWMERLGIVRPPEAVQWFTTNACNLHCPHCYTRAGTRSYDELSTEEACHLVVDGCVALGCSQIVIAGGEATLRRDLWDVIAHMKHRGLNWSMHTHGGLVERHRTKFEEFVPAMVAVSVDGPRTLHDSFRGREGSFDSALRSVRILKDAGCPQVVIGTSVGRQNADAVFDLWPTVRASGADSWGLHLVTPEGRAGDDSRLLATSAQLRRVAAFVRSRRAYFPITLDNEWGSAGTQDPHYRDQAFFCGAGRVSCVVSARGDVFPCTTLDPAECVGNVRATPLKSLWRSEFARFRGREDPLRSATDDCWLNTRHGRSCRRPAFLTDVHDHLLNAEIPVRVTIAR